MIEVEISVCDDCWENHCPQAWVRGYQDRMEMTPTVGFSCQLCGKGATMIAFVEQTPFGKSRVRHTVRHRSERMGAVL